ncbi:MAG TPA: RNA polymerase sigma factor [Chthoniobacterales bacterium]
MTGKSIDLEGAVAAYYQSLYRFALSLTRQEASAADLTQQTFLLLAQHGHQLRELEKLKGWLFTTLRREFLRLARRQNAHPEVSFESGEHEAATLDVTAARSADAHLILDALDALDDTYQVALKMYYLGELSYREIADALEIPIGTVMSRLSRGKEQLRARLSSLQGLRDSKIIPLPPEERLGRG